MAPIGCASEAAAVLQKAIPPRFRCVQECFVAVLLDAKHTPIGRPILIAVGCASHVEVHPRDVYRDAVKRNASAIIVAHQHPSGDVEPSSDDLHLTRKLAEAGSLLGIQLLDSLVIAPRGEAYVSLADRGILTTGKK